MRTMFFGMAVVIMLASCKDKAKPDLDYCVTLEQQDDYEDALTRCQAAVKADPASKSGKAAASELPRIQAKLDAIAAKERAAAAAAASAQAAEDARCHRWSTICTLGRFPDGSEQTTGVQYFKTKADCLSVGASLGNVPCDPCRCRE